MKETHTLMAQKNNKTERKREEIGREKGSKRKNKGNRKK